MRYKYDFEDRKKVNKKKIIFIALLLILSIFVASVLFKNSSNIILSNISSVILKPFVCIHDFTNSVFGKISGYFCNKESVVSRNNELEEENNSLKLQLLEMQKILDENTSLKQMLEIKKSFQHFDIAMGKIIYREHDNWTKTFRIDIGSDDGVKENQAVVSKEGLVGYISKVNTDTSVVTTILDPSSSVSVKISTVNEPAILKGDLDLKSKNRLKLEFIELDANISISDTLYTSGMGSLYPSSIPVGKIIEIVNSKNDIDRYAIVEPNVNIATISEVGVIIN